MLSVQHLKKSFGNHTVLKDVSLELAPSSISGIVGMNGAGKTTLLNILWNKLEATEAKQITWKDKPLKTEDIAFLEAQPFFYSRITGKEYLQLFQKFHPNFDYNQWNKIFYLPLTELIENYSSGMKKKLAFMSILSSNAPILILDEPFNNLDLETNLHLKQILLQMKSQGKTIIITSHILEVLTSFIDNIHLLNQGTISHTFSSDEFGEIEKIISNQQREESTELIKKLIG